MAKVCHSCGKGPAFGNSRSHSMVATRRRFNPNLQKVRILEAGAPKRAYVCTRCLKAGKIHEGRLACDGRLAAPEPTLRRGDGRPAYRPAHPGLMHPRSAHRVPVRDLPVSRFLRFSY